MGRIEKTVFISYRRPNYWTALAVYQSLHANGYDVFLDYRSIPSGDFEQALTENVTSRAHFVLILSPSALERCHETGDWLRREIETAIDYKRNIIPLTMEGFDFGSQSTIQALTGKLENLKNYNALGIPAEYFDEAMAKLRSVRFLDRPLDSISHPVSKITRNISEEQQSAANEAAPVEKVQLTAQEMFEKGLKAFFEGEFEEAIKNYSESIRIYPYDAGALSNRGLVYANRGNHDLAIADYTEAIRLDPDTPFPYSNRAYSFYDKGNYQLAIADFNKFIGLKPDLVDERFFTFRGLSHLSIEKYDDAIKDFEKATKINPKNPDAYYNLGYAYSKLNDVKREIDNYDIAINFKPDFAKAFSARAAARGDMGDFEGLIQDSAEAIRLDPNFAEAYNNKGNGYRRKGELENALDNFNAAIKINPKLSIAYFNRAGIFTIKKEYKKAISDYDQAIQLDKNNYNALINRGGARRAYGDIEGAIEDCRKAISLNQTEPEAYSNLVILLRIKGKTDEIFSLLEILFQLTPEKFDPYLAFASISKQLDQATPIEYIEKARQFMPEDDWYNRACLESVCDNFELALEYLEQAKEKELFPLDWAWKDPDLQWIRDDPRFVQIVGPKPE